ncbi:chaperone hchA [Purpureocillium lilacinum]|uniref:D-lactate dehydratase n=1 Tax=Purpureocillium lilacinum TaxID=33203 RepID=A0A179FEZ0_PURLI|nr:chaperone hchA [Purpureocillium lilacinum]
MLKTMSSDRAPRADEAEFDAWFPSSYSLSQYTFPKTDFDGAEYPNAYADGRWKILLIATEERYLRMADGKFFSTGNHPVEMLLPMMHLHAAGFDIDIATLGGLPVKMEMWAFPKEDEAVSQFFAKFKAKMRKPRNLERLWGEGFTDDSPYIGLFVPGGHGMMTSLPHSATVGNVLRWAHHNKRYLISLCHGPACMLAADIDKPIGSTFIYNGYKIVLFPDSLDSGVNVDIGYLPGQMEWLAGERLQKLGVIPVNTGMTGEALQDRYVLTGDSPLAANNLGRLAASVILDDVARRG